jgi:hypothetical protein
MKNLQITCIIVAIAVVAITFAAIYRNTIRETSSAPPNTVTAADVSEQLPSSVAPSAIPGVPYERGPSLLPSQKPEVDPQEQEQGELESPLQDSSSDPTPPKQDFSYLAYYAYAEVLPDKKPADTVLESLKSIPVGTPVEEIRRVSDAFGLDFVFMRAIAKIESDFDPKQRTGSYIGLFQLSEHEFEKYGSGNIADPRDNAVAAAYKFAVEAKLFELDTHKKATLSDIYLIHQQGVQGAAEHVMPIFRLERMSSPRWSSLATATCNGAWSHWLVDIQMVA